MVLAWLIVQWAIVSDYDTVCFVWLKYTVIGTGCWDKVSLNSLSLSILSSFFWPPQHKELVIRNFVFSSPTYLVVNQLAGHLPGILQIASLAFFLPLPEPQVLTTFYLYYFPCFPS